MAELRSQIEQEIRAQVVGQREEIGRKAKETADKAVAYAQSIAPVLTDLARAGHAATPEEFRDSIHAEKGGDVDGMPTYKVISDVPYARFLEYGTRYMHEYGTFAQTAHHFGGDLRGGINGPTDPGDEGDARGGDPT